MVAQEQQKKKRGIMRLLNPVTRTRGPFGAGSTTSQFWCLMGIWPH